MPRYRWPEPIDGLSGWQGWELHQATGFKLGWLLRPEERAGEIWPVGPWGMAVRLENANRLEAGGGLEGIRGPVPASALHGPKNQRSLPSFQHQARGEPSR